MYSEQERQSPLHFNGNKRYNDFSSFIRSTFSERVQKISINAGFTCPNRDGTKGKGGCTYCNNDAFSPVEHGPKKSVTQQLNNGIAFFSAKYKTQKYLAYFQNYTNTYADILRLKELYMEAASHTEVVGLVLGTRPDCITKDLIEFLAELSETKFISLELGIESTLDRTLELVNRCHNYQETKEAFHLLKNKGIHLGAHMIIGLPGESKDDMLNHASEISRLPINSLKLHQLQIVEQTVMGKQYRSNPDLFHLFGANEYVEFITDFLSQLRPDIIIDRFISQSPQDMLIAPKWGLKNFEIVAKIDKRLEERDLWQGKFWEGF